MKIFKTFLLILFVLIIGFAGYILFERFEHKQHGNNESMEVEAQSEEATGDHEEHEIELSESEIEEIGLKTSIAGPATIDNYLTLTGQIGFNQDKLAHIVPRVEGIVTQVTKNIGDRVQKGEIIAWLESAKLGEAKLDYVEKWTEVSCCDLDLSRAKQIHDNTIKLLEILDTSPSIDILRNTKDIEIGDNRSKLISAYAEYSFAKEEYNREKSLFEQKITSEQDYLKSQNAFKKADAGYSAIRDSIEFEIQRNLLEAQNSRQLQIMELKNAERQLKILGITNEDIKKLEFLVENQNISVSIEDDCDDPNCEECLLHDAGMNEIALNTIETEEKLAWYPLIAPFDGTIINKHITLGEMAKEDSEVFVIADMNNVWVDLQVYPKDMKHIKEGQKIVITADSQIPKIESTISYVSPAVSNGSRSILARVVIPNESGLFRPGLFVEAKVKVSSTSAKIAVPKESIQNLEGQKCVFVKDEHGFEPVFVETGQEDATLVEIISGLDAGQEYVTEGAFLLKSMIITSTLDSHAGHGH